MMRGLSEVSDSDKQSAILTHAYSARKSARNSGSFPKFHNLECCGSTQPSNQLE